ncbi:hypothetical protein ACFV2U_29285, partial [Streptomyces sp. NPDC059697]|uniref:hypothetical protein n=1 Tax=Streptomyces sp. NPDC059697 TaxID=3346912 RepID=UPI0036BBD1C9
MGGREGGLSHQGVVGLLHESGEVDGVRVVVVVGAAAGVRVGTVAGVRVGVVRLSAARPGAQRGGEDARGGVDPPRPGPKLRLRRPRPARASSVSTTHR